MKYILIFTIVLVSCSKSGRVEQPDFTNQHKVLLPGTWKYTAKVSDIPYDWDGNGTSETNIYSVMTDCQREFKLYLSENMFGTVNQDCGTPQKSISWQLLNNGWDLHWTISGASPTIELIQYISNAQLVTKSQTQPPGSGIITITNTYQKQ